jgi:cysteine desulfurase
MIYLDAAATTPVRREVLEAMWPYLTGEFGNPSSHHTLGEQAARALADARARVATCLNCRASEIIFTSGGTEADNLAIKGIALANPRGRHIVTTAIEHEAVLASCDYLRRHHGFTITYLPLEFDPAIRIALVDGETVPKDEVPTDRDTLANRNSLSDEDILTAGVSLPQGDSLTTSLLLSAEDSSTGRIPSAPHSAVKRAPSTGRIDLTAAREAITPETTLVTVMAANNEVGTVQPIAELAAIARAAGVLIHTDAVQAAGALALDVRALGVDALSLSGHKLGAPKGIGVLYLRGRVPVEAVLHGGGQERGRRSGTENVAGAVGFALALELATAEQPQRAAELAARRDELIRGVIAAVPGALLTGPNPLLARPNPLLAQDNPPRTGDNLLAKPDPVEPSPSTPLAVRSPRQHAAPIQHAAPFRLDEAADRIAEVVRSAVESVASVTTGRVEEGEAEGWPVRLPNSASFCFPGTSGEAMLLELERRGILCSSGSACAAGSSEPSHVLLALGYDPTTAQTAVRFTLTSST